jgi:hypothetical protein
MLDVNAPLEGNVESFFVPYDPSVNLRTFTTFCDRFEIDVPPEVSSELMRLFESFGCPGPGSE